MRAKAGAANGCWLLQPHRLLSSRRVMVCSGGDHSIYHSSIVRKAAQRATLIKETDLLWWGVRTKRHLPGHNRIRDCRAAGLSAPADRAFCAPAAAHHDYAAVFQAPLWVVGHCQSQPARFPRRLVQSLHILAASDQAVLAVCVKSGGALRASASMTAPSAHRQQARAPIKKQPAQTSCFPAISPQPTACGARSR